ncbi:MAG: 6-carboxytetrahydropterin synthase QueD [Acidaminococcaceae bacterium]|jgi:6-pyruvoyltetrahydropterin/6-carboxytetrahydropterin synthase|nr:6-carboxytetrahydropterin synthase QueD [Acidaminococcaceae bacterium]
MICIKEFEFDAAHYLPAYNGKCEHLHGHTYKLSVQVEGTPDAEGMVIDFVRLKKIVQDKVLSRLDHACLNDILPQPSAENIAKWVWQELVTDLQSANYKLYEVQIWETRTSGLIYRGD